VRFARAALLLLGACTQSDVVRVSLPPLGSAQSAILTLTAGNDRRAWALDLSSNPVDAPFIESGEAVDLALAAYEAPLVRIGLTAGPLDLAAHMDGRSLPSVVASFEMRVESSTAAWHTVNDVPPVIGRIRVPGPEGPCADLVQTTLTLPVMQSPGVLLVLDGERVLIGTHQGSFFIATRTGLTPVPALDGLPGMAFARISDGTLWLFGRGGATARGTLETGFTRTSSAPLARDLVLAEPVPGVRDDFFVVSRLGDVFRYDGSRWLTLFDGRGGDTYFRSFVSLSPTHFLLTSDSEIVHRYDRGTIVDETPATAAVAGETREIEALALIPELGVVASTSFDGKFAVDSGDRRWRLLPTPAASATGLGVGADEMIAYRGGFWVAGTTGAHTQWYPSWGFCSPGHPFSNKPILRVTVQGDALVAVTDYDVNGGPPVVLWLDPR